jgi:hypothetical protein
MREGAVYTIGILAPLVALALVAALGGESSRRVSGLPGGGFVEWIYPRSAIREVVAYAGVALWLLRERRRRTPDEFRRTLWRASAMKPGNASGRAGLCLSAGLRRSVVQSQFLQQP